jgi:hypothetical protein
MQQVSWTRRPLPLTPAVVPAAWEWELCTPIDLTLSRGDLRAAVRAGRLPGHVHISDVDGLLLVFEELTSNGLCHGQLPVGVRVVCTGSGWLIDVTDAAVDCPPAPALDRDPAEGGLGLHLVARLSEAYGWTVLDGRKHVWACLEGT